MKLAILGADSSVLALATEIASRPELEIAYLCELGTAHSPEAAELLRAVAREAKPLDTWESLLDPGFVDGVIVCRGANDDLRSDQLRKFAQEKIPVLISHPVVDSMLLYYELDMIRRDTGAIIVPALVERLNPQITELASQVVFGRTNETGKAEQVTIERRAAVRSKRAVLEHFSHDVDLLRYLCGELNQISAMGTTGEESAYGNLIVQMQGPEKLPARWSIQPAELGVERVLLTVTGVDGQSQLELPINVWARSTPSPEYRDKRDWNASAAILDVFLRAISQDPKNVGVADLIDAARACELTETIPRSLARRRTIDLHLEDHTEENTFKGKMAVGGCVLLMLGLALLFFVAILDKANLPGARYWPWLLAVLFGGFSLLQLLSFAFKKQ